MPGDPNASCDVGLASGQADEISSNKSTASRAAALARTTDVVAIGTVLTIAIGSSIVRWFTTLNHDTAYFRAQAKMLSQGRHLLGLIRSRGRIT